MRMTVEESEASIGIGRCEGSSQKVVPGEGNVSADAALAVSGQHQIIDDRGSSRRAGARSV